MNSPCKQLTLHLVSLILCTLDTAHVEPALTEVSCLLIIQELAAAQTAELCRLSGGESHWVIVKEELVTRNVSGEVLSRIVKFNPKPTDKTKYFKLRLDKFGLNN